MSLPGTNWAGLTVNAVENIQWIAYSLAAKKGPTDLFRVSQYLFTGAVLKHLVNTFNDTIGWGLYILL